MDWMIYGANGYTGELIAREAKKRGANPVVAGRDATKIAKLATDLSLPSKVFSLDKPPDIAAALHGMGLVLNCAGPFSKTADPLMRACLIAKTHYLDITGEIDVLEGAHRLDADAKSAGVVLCPGVGFDVTPTDCIALMLKTHCLKRTSWRWVSKRTSACRRAPPRRRSKRWARAVKFDVMAGSSIFPSGADVGRSISVGGQSWRCRFPGVTSPQPFTRRAFRTSRSSRPFLRRSWR